MQTGIAAQPLKQDVVALCAKFDPSEESHWGVPPLGLLEHDRVQVLDGDPPKDCPRFLHIGLALAPSCLTRSVNVSWSDWATAIARWSTSSNSA